jgi:hypothetical protein
MAFASNFSRVNSIGTVVLDGHSVRGKDGGIDLDFVCDVSCDASEWYIVVGR